MRYTAMIVGFLLATLTAVGATETGQPDYVAFKVHDLAGTKTFAAIFGWTLADAEPSHTSFEIAACAIKKLRTSGARRIYRNS